jgi:hypothetical protein
LLPPRSSCPSVSSCPAVSVYCPLEGPGMELIKRAQAGYRQG